MIRVTQLFVILSIISGGASSARAADDSALDLPSQIEALEASTSEDFVADAAGGAEARAHHALYARLVTAYNLRVYRKGAELGLQLDVKNLGTYRAYGPRVSVRLKGLGTFSNAKIYQYDGSASSAPNTIPPKKLGYIVVTLPAGKTVVQGQAVDVTVTPEGASNFPKFTGTMIGCQKGTFGCE